MIKILVHILTTLLSMQGVYNHCGHSNEKMTTIDFEFIEILPEENNVKFSDREENQLGMYTFNYQNKKKSSLMTTPQYNYSMISPYY